jgi:hypothetical protein
METSLGAPASSEALERRFSLQRIGVACVSPAKRVPTRARRVASAGHQVRASMFALVSAAALALTAGSARAEPDAGPGACDALTDYLRDELGGPAPVVPSVLRWAAVDYGVRETDLEARLRATEPASPSAYARRVTPACRAEIRRGAAPAATAAARAWTQRRERGWIERGRIIRCAMQDPAALAELDEWMSNPYQPEARAVCVGELATWPDAALALSGTFERSVQRVSPETWEIDDAVVAAANVMGTPELREQLAPVLVAAHMRRALGYDRLYAAVCTNDGAMSGDRARACSTLPAEAEREWRSSEPPRTNRWVVRGVATAVYAGLVTAERFEPDGRRTLPTLAGVVGGGVAGTTALFAITKALDYPRDRSDELVFKALLVSSLIAGGVAGGLVAHAIAASPGARAPATAVGLAPVYLLTLASTFD